MAEQSADPNFKGSIFEKLGFDAQRCPHCEAYLKNGICLNGCTLPGWQYRALIGGVRPHVAKREERPSSSR